LVIYSPNKQQTFCVTKFFRTRSNLKKLKSRLNLGLF
jgi:hypothetical protein